MLAQRADIRDLDDGLPLPGIDWKIDVDKAEAAKYGASVDTVGTARAARHQRRRRSPNTGRPTATRRSTSWCASRRTGAASTRSTNCACRRRPAHVPIGNFVERVPAPRVGYINRVAGNRVMTVSANVAEGVQTAKVQQEIAAGACRRRSRRRRHLQAEGRGRGARQGRRLPDEGVRHRDLPDLRDPAGAVQPAHLGRPGARPRWCCRPSACCSA